MYYRFQRRYNLLTVPDDFAYLRQVYQNGDLDFVFFYKISPHDAVAHEALTVNISVFARTITMTPMLEHSHLGFIDTRKLIKNILNHMPRAKSVNKQQAEFNVAFRRSDISTAINNEVVGQLRAKVPSNNIQQMWRSSLKLVPAGSVTSDAEIKPVLTQMAHSFTTDIHTVYSASIDENPTRLMHDMIYRQGIDPSHIIHLTHRSVPSVDAVGGLLRPSRALEHEHSPLTRLLNHHIFPTTAHHPPAYTNQVQDSSVVHVLTQAADTHVEIPTQVTIPRHALKLASRHHSHFFVKFELINGRTGVAIDTITKTLNTAQHAQLYYTPRRPPTVKVTKSELSSRANLEIKQNDPGATGVQVYKKNVFRAVVDIDDYTLIGTYNVKKNEQSLLVQVDLPRNSVAIFRVVPTGLNGTQGYEYTNVVVKPSHYKPVKSLSLTAQPIDIGVRLEVRQIPQHVVAIELKARNKSIFESEYRNVGSGITLIDETIRTADFFTLVDRDVSQNHIYEYVAKLVYESGTSELTANTIIDFITPVPGKVDTRIQNLVVSEARELNVTFDISTEIIDNNADVVKKLLHRQDIFVQFKDDVAREREFLKSLIAHNIQRVDLTTGAREDFGVVTTSSFSDEALRKNLAIQPLKAGHKYRYEVVALLRAPETMFETLSKEKVDVVTKKTHNFSPAKFLHPITLSRGVIVSSAGLKTRYAKEPMSHGAIGSVETVEATFDVDPANIIEASASRFDKYLNTITWKIEGDINSIDHFIIMKDVHGVRTVIGKAHSEFLYGNCQYLHPVSRRDEGSFVYVISPIFNDYKKGREVTTNSVVVEPFVKGVSTWRLGR